MSATFDFEDIRPYYDEEVTAVMQALTSKGSFFMLMQFLFPGRTRAEITRMFLEMKNIEDFQRNFSYPAVRSILAQSAGELTHAGFDFLGDHKAHLLLSNHRDIILDPGTLNVLRLDEGYPTCQLGIGSNLLFSPLLTALMKLNKSFTVKREGARHEMYLASHQLSAYIRHIVAEKGESAWLSHRNGRTKDGDDRTQPGVLKMLSLSGSDDFVENFAALSLVPMAISYEYEPCDSYKAREMAHLAVHGSYTKTRDEDKNSMIAGMRNPKGRIHLELGKPVSPEELERIARQFQKNDRMKALAELIDTRIYAQYRLWPTNYMAYDLECGTDRYAAAYDEATRAQFVKYLEARIAETGQDTPLLRKSLLAIYSNPVRNYERSREML